MLKDKLGQSVMDKKVYLIRAVLLQVRPTDHISVTWNDTTPQNSSAAPPLPFPSHLAAAGRQKKLTALPVILGDG